MNLIAATSNLSRLAITVYMRGNSVSSGMLDIETICPWCLEERQMLRSAIGSNADTTLQCDRSSCYDSKLVRVFQAVHVAMDEEGVGSRTFCTPIRCYI